jgi:hypothetical protein
MKIKSEHYSFLESKIKDLLPKIKMHSEQLKLDSKVKNHSTRLMWDTFHALKVYDHFSYSEFDYLDSHIETAMKKIFKTLEII